MYEMYPPTTAPRGGYGWLMDELGLEQPRMATAQTNQESTVPGRQGRFTGGWRRIGPRLLAGFLLLIVPTLVIGVVAVQRFSTLTATTTELSKRDLPEIVTLDRLRTLLYQQLDVEQGGGSDPTAGASGAKLLAQQRAALLALQPQDTSGPGSNDTTLVRTLIDGIVRSNALALRIDALDSRGQVAQARALRQQQVPLIQSLITAAGQLRALEDREAIAAADQVQRESSMATRLALTLTLLAVPLSILLAVLLTRSLTRPLSALLGATRGLAAGNLEASPHLTSRDEIGQLAAAFDSMRSSLRTTISALALERQQTQAIIDASADGVILVDGHQRIIQMNPSAAQLTGWGADEAIGQPCWMICGCPVQPASPPACLRVAQPGSADAGRSAPALNADSNDRDAAAGPACPATVLARAIDGGSIVQELLIQPHNGQQRWLAISCAPVPGSTGATDRRVVVSLHDISALKALDQLKTDFVAMVSHELRAPLTTVGGAVEMLGQIDPSADGGSYREVLDILEQQTRRLRTVVEEVLQVTRLQAGRLPVRLQPLPLRAFLHGLLERVRQDWAGDERPVQMPGGDEVVVWADPAMLEVVLRNLLDNARKYTPPASPLEFEILSDAAGRVQVRLSDHGPGIPPDQIERIFERFSRGHRSASEWTRGYGLGLYIARELLRAHNGEIWAENYGGGARFVFSLCTVAAGEAGEPRLQEAVV
jgi:signal transduction histidine kinase